MSSNVNQSDDELPDWLKNIAASHTAQVAEPVPLSSRLEWPLLADAAVVSGFLPEQLGLGRIDGTSRSIAEQAVLRRSYPSYGLDGPRWVLEDNIRVQVIGEAARVGALLEVVDNAASRFNDPLTVAIRDCLREPNLHEKTLSRLEAQRAAMSWLAAIPNQKLPSIEELDREIARRRLLSDFARMIGRSPDAVGPSKEECFFGRKAELLSLADHATSESVLGNVTRLAARVVGSDQPVMTVWGIGGVGKTTLISKFMLQHAEVAQQRRRFPYAYIDFDRAIVSARDRAGLLVEICSQVMSQFGDLANELQQLKSRVEDVARKMASRPEGASISLLRPCADQFRTILDRYLSARESRFGIAVPFLIVFDTFEIVQYAPDDVVGLEDLMGAFSSPDERGVWPRLRLVISGRQKVDRFLGPVDPTQDLELSVLDADGSADMLVALAKGAQKSITKKQATALVEDLSRVAGHKTSGVQPLRLKLVGALFKSEKGTGPEIVASLRTELAAPLTVTGLAGKTLIDGVLIRRVLDHVTDSRVKALADPGLVVRYITPAVIEHVMAPGTPDPNIEQPEDYASQRMWTISTEEAADIFKAFSNEGTLVEPGGVDTLHHRADVRLEMLPLIRARSRQQFDRLHQLAYDYFTAEARSTRNERYADEAIYHGLWLRKPLEELDEIWRRQGGSFDPKVDPDEFDDDTIANMYLRAKRGAPVAGGELQRLPTAVALDWLDSRGSEMLGQRSAGEAVDAMRVVAGDGFHNLDERPSSAAVLARLLYRAGLWQDSLNLVTRQLARLSPPTPTPNLPPITVSFFRIWSTLLAKAPHLVESDEVELWRSAVTGTSGSATVEILAHMRLFAAAQSARRSLEAYALPLLDAAIPTVSQGEWGRELRVLRLVILTGTLENSALVDLYAQRNERVPRERGAVPSLEPFFRMLDPSGEWEAPMKELKMTKRPSLGAFERIDDIWRRRVRPGFLDALKKSPEMVLHAKRAIVFDHGDWRWVLGNALSRELKEDDGLVARVIQEQYIPGRRGVDERDGLSIVQAAVDGGRLLEFARSLREWEKHRLLKPADDTVPQDVYSVGRALLAWHALIGRIVTPDQPSA